MMNTSQKVAIVLALALILLAALVAADNVRIIDLESPIDTHKSVATGFNLTHLPDVNSNTAVTATVEIASSLGIGSAEGNVTFEISPDNSTWSLLGSWDLLESVGGIAATGAITTRSPSTFIIPPGYTYRLMKKTSSGSPTFTIVSIYELNMTNT